MRNESKADDLLERAVIIIENSDGADQHGEWLDEARREVRGPKKIPQSFHHAAGAVARSNNWDYAYALGYVSGCYDAEDRRGSEHEPSEDDDYAKGYHQGFAQTREKLRFLEAAARHERSGESVERVRKDACGVWTCLCGNAPEHDGFFPCDEKGTEVEPDPANWKDPLYVCDRCGRIIESESRYVIGKRRVEKGQQ